MASKLSDKWESLDPEKRQSLFKGGIVGLFCLIATIYWYSSGKNQVVAKPGDKFAPLSATSEMFNDDISQSIQRHRSDSDLRNSTQDEQLVQQETKINTLERLVTSLEHQLQDFETQPASLSSHSSSPLSAQSPSLDDMGLQTNVNPSVRFPVPPNSTVSNDQSISPDSLEEAAPTIIGGIAHVAGEPLLVAKQTKKKAKKIYLPPSFMDALLLTGLDASTIEGANAHPQPFMLRVQEPAVLPNAIKANLQGCFVVAHGFGALNSERIESRLVSLNCLSKDGQALIDSPVKGYVADKDGKSGLKGLVVSKQGAHLARVFAAGVFGGIGKVAEQSANTVTVSPLTGATTAVLDPQKAFQGGLGSGIADASKDMRKFFLDLAKQASPVIEVGPAKKVTVVITEGAWLTIRDSDDV